MTKKGYIRTEPRNGMTEAEAAAMGGRAIFKLDDALHNRVIDLVRMGCYVQVACAASGIGANTYFRWLRRGREIEAQVVEALGDDHDLDENTTCEQLQAVLPGLHENDWRRWRLGLAAAKADAEAEAYAVGTVRKAMPDNWAAAMTFLERKHGKRWRRSETVHHELADGEGVDEDALLEEGASSLVHDALRQAARGELPEHVDSDATELDSPNET